jgi:hypothetical protein
VNMVGHHHIGIKMTVLALQGFAQRTKIDVAILVIEETGPAIVATVHDMQRYTVDVDARSPRRRSSLAAI